MKTVDAIARVRRAFYVQGWSVKRICRELHLSRNTVRKVLRSDDTSFSYERERQPMPKIGPWRDELDRLLLANHGKASRERLTMIRIYEELHALGCKGSYDAVRRYAKNWAKEQGSVTADAYVPASFYPGTEASSMADKHGFDVRRQSGFPTIALSCFFLLYMPIVALVVYAFNAGVSVAIWEGFSLRWFVVAWNNAQVQEASWRSLRIATCAAVIATAAATMAALATTRTRPYRGLNAKYAFISMPLMVPEVVVAVALLIFFSRIKLATGYTGLG
jgi:hypothetical protein